MKKTMVLFGPPDTHSGYGNRSADLFRAIIELYKDEYDISVISRRWGETPRGALNPKREGDKLILDRIVQQPPQNIDVSVQVTVPNEFQRYGKYNIGVTAGIETTVCSMPWIEGLNRMDLILTSSEFGKNVLANTAYTRQLSPTQQDVVKLNKPIDVLFEGYDNTVYKATESTGRVKEQLDNIPEDFAFLVVGHWLQGDFGQDRKNMGMTINSFLEAYKDKEEKPALILKISGGAYSITDKKEITDKIEMIKNFHQGSDLPNVYLVYGNLTKDEMNSLYNHDKVKAMYSLTRGEGFGRPLLEFATTGKPIIVSNWSGHLDFLKGDEHILVGGKLEQPHPSAQWKDVIIPESKWFTADYRQAIGALHYTYNNYRQQLQKAKKGKDRVTREFTYSQMKNRIKHLFDKNIQVQTVVQPILPKLKKIK